MNNNLKEIEQLKNIILNISSPLGKLCTEYIFNKIKDQTTIKGLKEISYQYYKLLKNPLFSKVYTRFTDENIFKLFSIKIGEENDIKELTIELKPLSLDSKGILNIAEFIESFVNFKKNFLNFLKNQSEFKDISQFILSSSNFNELLNTIFHFIDRKGNIKDSATPELKKIREEIYKLNKTIPQKLNEFIKENSEYLISNQIGFKNNRFVVYLNSQYVSNFEGIVQDYSWTHKTAFFEPSSIIDINNRLILLQSLENIEIQKILSFLFEKIAENINNISSVIKICAFIEFFNSYFSLHSEFCKTESNENKVEIIGLVNLLIENCVPIDIKFEKALMIVGPNSGGKSISLKSLALAILLSNVGLPIPAKYANLPYLKVFYDNPDPQNIEKGLSTFSGHVNYWKYIIENLNITNQKFKNIVIMDEPASGTDPFEASIITIALIEYFLSKNSLVAFCTHYNIVKNFFYKKITTASVNFNFETNKSTYQLIYDIILPSYPLNLLNELPSEFLEKIEQIKNYLSSSSYEEKITNIFLEALKIKNELLEKKNQINKQLEEIEQMKNQIKQKVKTEIFEKLYKEYSKEIQKLIENWEKELQKLKNSSNITKSEKRLKTIKNFDLNDYLLSFEGLEENISIKENDFVKIKIFDEIGVVKSVRENKVIVQVNDKVYELNIDQVKKILH